jgi:hypothetical protein
VLSGLPGVTLHLYRTPPKYVLVASEEVDELAFLSGVQAGPDLNDFCRVFDINLYDLGILDRFESTV